MPNQVVPNTGQKVTTIEELQKRQRLNNQKVKIVEKGKTPGMNRDTFLKLLVTQLSKQDPINPVNDREFIAQMAQFSSLEQMHNVSKELKGLKKLQVNFLIGKKVTGPDFVSGKPLSGVVDRIVHDQKGQVFLMIGGRAMNYQAMVSVENAPEKPAVKNVSRETFRPQAFDSHINLYKQNQKQQAPVNTGK